MTEINNRIEEVKKLIERLDRSPMMHGDYQLDPMLSQDLRNFLRQLFPQPLDMGASSIIYQKIVGTFPQLDRDVVVALADDIARKIGGG